MATSISCKNFVISAIGFNPVNSTFFNVFSNSRVRFPLVSPLVQPFLLFFINFSRFHSFIPLTFTFYCVFILLCCLIFHRFPFVSLRFPFTSSAYIFNSSVSNSSQQFSIHYRVFYISYFPFISLVSIHSCFPFVASFSIHSFPFPFNSPCFPFVSLVFYSFQWYVGLKFFASFLMLPILIYSIVSKIVLLTIFYRDIFENFI